MNFDSDDRLIAGALSDMEEQMPEVDLLPGVYAKLSAHRKRRPLRMALAAAIAAALLITGCAAALGGLDWIGEMMNGWASPMWWSRWITASRTRALNLASWVRGATAARLSSTSRRATLLAGDARRRTPTA